MKLVFVSYPYWPPDFGGELLIRIESFQALAKRGHQITALTSGQPGCSGRECLGGINVIRSPLVHSSKFGRLLRRLVFPVWVYQWLLRQDFDIVHLARAGGIDPVTDAVGMWLVSSAARARKKRVVVVHSLATSDTAFFSLKGFHGRLRKMYLDGVDDIVSVSPALNDAVAEYYPQKASLLTFGIQDRFVSHLSKEERFGIRESLGVPDNEVVFTFIGSVSRRKGFDTLAAAFSELAVLHPNWKLWVIGPRTKDENQNIVESEVEEVTASLASSGRQVRFWGRVNDRDQLARLLAASDAFVFPSRREGFGLAPAEAMAVGLPVIISRIAGVTDVVSIEGVTGFYITPGSVVELKQAMEKLGANQELREEMGSAARARIQAVLGWQSYLDRMETFYSGERKL